MGIFDTSGSKPKPVVLKEGFRYGSRFFSKALLEEVNKNLNEKEIAKFITKGDFELSEKVNTELTSQNLREAKNTIEKEMDDFVNGAVYSACCEVSENIDKKTFLEVLHGEDTEIFEDKSKFIVDKKSLDTFLLGLERCENNCLLVKKIVQDDSIDPLAKIRLVDKLRTTTTNFIKISTPQSFGAIFNIAHYCNGDTYAQHLANVFAGYQALANGTRDVNIASEQIESAISILHRVVDKSVCCKQEKKKLDKQEKKKLDMNELYNLYDKKRDNIINELKTKNNFISDKSKAIYGEIFKLRK